MSHLYKSKLCGNIFWHIWHLPARLKTTNRYNSKLQKLENANVDVVYLDFAKVSDKIDHTIVLQKIKDLRINGQVYTWMESFLRNRYISLKVQISGVPQGSVLGPLKHFYFWSEILTMMTCPLLNCNVFC